MKMSTTFLRAPGTGASPSDLISRTLVGGVLPLCQDAVGVFCSPSQLGYQDTHWWESSPSAEMQLVYSAAPANLATKTLIGKVLPLCRDAVGVFCSPSQLGHQDTHWESLTPSAEMQLVYSAAPANLATKTLIGRVLPLCRDAVGVFCSPSQLNRLVKHI